jgi:hypothetical protein
MTNRERLIQAGILKSAPPEYSPQEIGTLESLTEDEMNLILNQSADITEVISNHLPSLFGVAFGRLTNP